MKVRKIKIKDIKVYINLIFNVTFVFNKIACAL